MFFSIFSGLLIFLMGKVKKNNITSISQNVIVVWSNKLLSAIVIKVLNMIY